MNLVMFCYQQVHSNSKNDYCLDSCKGIRSFTRQGFGTINANDQYSQKGK